MGKTIPGTVKLTKKAYKDKYFGESMIFRWYGNIRKGCLSAEVASKPNQPESVVNNWNINTVWAILQENGQMTYEEKVASAYISKTALPCYSR